MRGHRQIEGARWCGYKPKAVFVVVGSCPVVRYEWQDPERVIDFGGFPVTSTAHPVVYTESTPPALADLRFLVGCRVHLSVHAGRRDAFWDWLDAIKAAGAREIYGVDPEGEVQSWRG